jgi:hypothetical protein
MKKAEARLRLAVPALMMAALGANGCGDKVAATIPISPATGTGDVTVSLPAGTNVDFPVTASRVSIDPKVDIDLHVELLRGAVVVATVDCTAFSARGAYTQAKFWSLGGECGVWVPPGGVTSVHAAVRVSRAGGASIAGLAVEVRQPR